MKEYFFETVTETKQIGHTSICNRCGKRNEIIQDKHYDWEDDIKNFSIGFGYESKFDGENWRFDLCEDCLVSIIKEFKYVPEGFKEDRYNSFSSPEEHQKVFDHWKETGNWEELKFKTYEELKAMNNGWFDYEYINDAVKKYHPDKPELEPYKED